MVELGRPHQCIQCPYKSRTCKPRGPVDSPFVIVGESPGTNEIIKNAPFVGPSGEVLRAALNGGVEPFYTNAIQCLPKNKDMQNLATACQACNTRLIEEITAYPRKAILALGNAALWSLTGDYSTKITQTRGRVFSSPLADHGIVACVHPAFLMRGGGSSRLFKRDVQLAQELATTGVSKYKYKEVGCIVMETEGDIRDLIDKASEQEYIAADLETTGFSARVDYILSHGFCWNTSEAYIVPPHLFHLLGDIYNPSVVPAQFIWHNGKFDVGFLRGAFDKEHSNWRAPVLQDYIRHQVAVLGNRWGYQYARTDQDTMLMSYAIDENNGIHGLEVLGNDVLGAPNWKGVLDQWLPKKGASYANVPPDILYLYQAKDLGTTWQIFQAYRPQVAADPQLEKLYSTHLLQASEFLTWVEAAGFQADIEVMAANDITVKTDYENKLAEFHVISNDAIGISVNPNSWQQVQQLLYKGGLDIADGKILKTDEKTLQPYSKHPAVKCLQECRQLRKLHSQYVVSLRDAVEPDGRIHTTFKLHATTTGRLASSDPVNLQNIVRDDRIKNQFCAAKGKWLLSNDLSQAELRVLAILSGDPALCAIFEPGSPSIHKIVAAKFYGATYTEDQYQLAKAVTFGIVYGRDAFSIAVEYGITVKEAQSYIDNWFAQFPQAKAFIQRCRLAPLQGKIMKTPWGRKRRFGIVGPERVHDVGNQAANFPEQSIASDITLEAGYLSKPQLEKWGVRVVNIVHDDIIKELPQDESLAMDVINLVQGHMREVPIRRGLTRVPFESEWKIGTHWGSLQKKSQLPIDFFQKARYNEKSAGEQSAQGTQNAA